MTREELLDLVAEVQCHRTELDDIEVKAAHKGTPKQIYEILSAFANRPGGGVILFGLAEQGDFGVIGTGDSHRLQEEVSHVASSEMEPALRPEFMVEEIEGKTVVAIEVPGIPNDQKPCYYKPAGLPGGAYIRVGNTNR